LKLAPQFDSGEVTNTESLAASLPDDGVGAELLDLIGVGDPDETLVISDGD
jgi:hypothetical protein